MQTTGSVPVQLNPGVRNFVYAGPGSPQQWIVMVPLSIA